jgi:carbon-monoxide dehydrogenase large subunit
MTNPGIGSSPRRREDYRLITGAGTFGDDFTLPGQAFATIARSPHAHAILRRIETTRACALPGVLAVLTAADYLADGLKPLIHSPFTISPPDITLRNHDGKKHSRQVLNCEKSERAVLHGCGKVYHRRPCDWADAIKDDAENKLQI